MLSQKIRKMGPRKTWKPQHPEGFSKRSAASARPRVAKAMRLATPPNGEASPDLSAYARQLARGPCWGDMGLAGSKIFGLCCPILRLCCSILGLCWPTLALCWPVLGPRLADLEAYVDPCWAKRSEKWEQQKNTVKRRLTHLGAMLAYLEGNMGPSWGYVGRSWGHVGPSWGYVAPSWAHVGPSWGLCWPILRPMLAHCWPMLTHLEPQDPKKKQKIRRAQNTVERGSFWPDREVGGRGGGPSLSYGEERTAVRQCHGQGPLAGFWADAHRRLRRTTRPSISSQCGLESYWMRTCCRNIFLRFFGT